jgi:hypothetical protein
LGIFISKRPFKVIAATLTVVFICSFGISQFYEEKNMVKLWIPQDIDFSKNYHWLMKNFPPDIRYIFQSSFAGINAQQLKVQRRVLEVFDYFKGLGQGSEENLFSCFNV